MKRILAFGDSNTWGYDPATTQRFDKNTRWTGLLQNALNDQALILEEGLCGRTTVFDDDRRDGRNGFAALPGILRAFEPIDVAIIMLGTNDCKSAFGAEADVIAAGLELCLAKIMDYVHPENILIISPIHLEKSAIGAAYDSRSLSTSRALKRAYQMTAGAYGAAFLAASDVTKASDIDGEHLDEEGHRAFCEAILRNKSFMK